MLSSLHARMIRSAISPRLAINTLLNTLQSPELSGGYIIYG